MKKFLKDLLDISELETELQDKSSEITYLKQRLSALQLELIELKENKISDADLENRIDELVEELEAEPEKNDFSPAEQKIIWVLLNQEGYMSSSEIADMLDKSSGTVRKYISMLSEKIDFSVRKQGRKKLYSLSEEFEKELLGDLPETSIYSKNI